MNRTKSTTRGVPTDLPLALYHAGVALRAVNRGLTADARSEARSAVRIALGNGRACAWSTPAADRLSSLPRAAANVDLARRTYGCLTLWTGRRSPDVIVPAIMAAAERLGLVALDAEPAA